MFSLLDGKNKSRMGLLLCYIRDPERWTENRARKEARNTLNRSMMNTIGARFSKRKQLVLGVCVSACVCMCVSLCECDLKPWLSAASWCRLGVHHSPDCRQDRARLGSELRFLLGTLAQGREYKVRCVCTHTHTQTHKTIDKHHKSTVSKRFKFISFTSSTLNVQNVVLLVLIVICVIIIRSYIIYSLPTLTCTLNNKTYPKSIG